MLEQIPDIIASVSDTYLIALGEGKGVFSSCGSLEEKEEELDSAYGSCS